MKVYANDSSLGSTELGIERGLKRENIIIIEYTISIMYYEIHKLLWKYNTPLPHKLPTRSLSIL